MTDNGHICERTLLVPAHIRSRRGFRSEVFHMEGRGV